MSLRNQRILLIGAVNLGMPPTNGEEYKNQILCDHLSTSHSLSVVDTKDWKRKPVVLAALVYHITVPSYDSIILSASSASVHRLLHLMRGMKSRRARTIYMVIGGYVHKCLAEGRYRTEAYQGLSSIVVEGEGMREQLLLQGIRSPVVVMPNFKDIRRTWGDVGRFESKHVKFLFLSRVSESKGIPLIFDAMKDPRLSGRMDDFSVDFYGPIEEGYRERFETHLKEWENLQYKGYLDIYNDTDLSYQTIASYHAMLFPTTWMGEGFPGVLLDAYACGLPVIASDWNMNREVVADGRTGAIVPPNDSKALADKILDVLERRDAWAVMSRNCHEEAMRYDAGRVLDAQLPSILETNGKKP